MTNNMVILSEQFVVIMLSGQSNDPITSQRNIASKHMPRSCQLIKEKVNGVSVRSKPNETPMPMGKEANKGAWASVYISNSPPHSSE